MKITSGERNSSEGRLSGELSNETELRSSGSEHRRCGPSAVGSGAQRSGTRGSSASRCLYVCFAPPLGASLPSEQRLALRERRRSAATKGTSAFGTQVLPAPSALCGAFGTYTIAALRAAPLRSFAAHYTCLRH